MNPPRRLARITLFALLGLTLAAGCGDPSTSVHDSPDDARPEPLAWFDELSRRATQRDTAYVRSHTRERVLTDRAALKADARSNDPAAALCEALVLSKPSKWSPTDDSRRIALSATRIAPGMFGGTAWQYTVDLYYESGGGWKIASWPYGQQTVTAPGPPPTK